MICNFFKECTVILESSHHSIPFLFAMLMCRFLLWKGPWVKFKEKRCVVGLSLLLKNSAFHVSGVYQSSAYPLIKTWIVIVVSTQSMRIRAYLCSWAASFWGTASTDRSWRARVETVNHECWQKSQRFKAVKFKDKNDCCIWTKLGTYHPVVAYAVLRQIIRLKSLYANLWKQAA